MKTIIVSVTLLICCQVSPAQSPNFSEWFSQKKTQIKYLVQQVAALKVYLGYLKTGYDIVDKGLTNIGNIKNGSFLQDETYLHSLKQVSPAVKKSPKVEAIISLQQQVMLGFHRLVTDTQTDDNFNLEEKNYIDAVYENMLIECNDSMDELILITTSGETEMKDDERLLRLDKVYEDMQGKYAFTQDFIAGTRLLSIQRAKEKFDLDVAVEFSLQEP